MAEAVFSHLYKPSFVNHTKLYFFSLRTHSIKLRFIFRNKLSDLIIDSLTVWFLIAQNR